MVQEAGSSDQRLRAAVESAPSGLLMIDAEGRIVLLNREIERLFGYPREELLGRSIETLVPERFRGHHSAFRAGFLSSPKVRAMGAGRDLYGLRKDGAEVPVEIGLTPVVTSEGLFVLSSIVDISARKHAEEQRHQLEDQLRQAQKMEAVGTLAGGIAHDFNNMLGAIVGYAELLRAQVGDRKEALADLTEILSAAKRGRDLIERMLAFSRRQPPERRPLDLVATIRGVHRLLRASMPTTVDVRLSLVDSAQRVAADETSVHQVVMNLATNALHAMPEGGTLDIELGPTYVRDSVARAHPELREGPYSLLTIRDTGGGIDPAIRDRVFEPFFTTKPQGAGSGLGLAMVHGIMRDHQGTVLLESEVGRGTAVKCFFPLLEADAVTEAAAQPDLVEGHGERVLYVDDEPALARVGERRLAMLGYQVTVETDPVAALERFRRDPSAFELVVTDFTMPRLTGSALAKAIVELRPGLPVIMLTGFVEDTEEASLQTLGVRRVLRKPVTMQDLSEAVRAVLDG